MWARHYRHRRAAALELDGKRRSSRCLSLTVGRPALILVGADVNAYISYARPKWRASVASPNYHLFERAMRMRKQMCCLYEGYPRELCPIILGHSQGQEKALTYQIGGQSRSGLPPGGEWRCLWLAKVSESQLRDGEWLVGSSHTRPQGCVEVVDLDVNPSSPYRPKRRVGTPDRRPARRRAIRRSS